jgi:hypothetical protein
MNFPYLCPGPHTLTISATGNNQTVNESQRVTSTGGSTTGKPEIVTFDGPSSVTCTGTETVTVDFQYETKNATTVDPEIDGQPVGAQAGYDPHRGTMSFPYVCPGPHTLTIDAGGANGQSAQKSARVTSGGASTKPQVLEFNGPDTASCGTSGNTVTLSYSYRTKNATAVEPEIDGENPGAQAGYNPSHGVMRFAYVCPGPHTLTITAFGKNNQSTSESVDVAPSSAG